MLDNGFYPTNRTFKCSNTKEEYSLFHSKETGGFKLIKTAENGNYEFPKVTEVNGFEIRAYDVAYRFEDGKIVNVKNGEFLHLDIENQYTHYKILGTHKRFVKRDKN